jgi:hypothetical protein
MSDEDALRRDSLTFLQQYVAPCLDDANTRGENPAVVLYALLEGAMRVCQGHFPEHADNLYVSATQMVFEAHQAHEGAPTGESVQ